MKRKEKKELEEKKQQVELALIAERIKIIEKSNSLEELDKALKHLIHAYKSHVRDDDLWYISRGGFSYLQEINDLIDIINKLKKGE